MGNEERDPNTAGAPPGMSADAWQLFQAAAFGDLTTVTELVDAKPALLHEELWYEFPLHYAVRGGHAEVVQRLLDAGTNPAHSSWTYSSWQALLPIADDRGFDDVHELLVAEMQRRFNYDPDYRPLWDAIVANDLARVQQLVEERPELVCIGDEHGNRALHWALLARRIPIMEFLLDAGADVNARRADQQTALHLSIVGDYWFGKTNRSDPETSTVQVTEFLLAQSAEREFTVVAALGDLEAVKAALAENPALARELNTSRRSPLYHAARGGHLEIVRLLLEHGADPNLAEECAGGGRALFEASARQDIPMMQLLIEHGAKADAYVDSCGNCLSICDYESESRAEAIELLVQHGAREGLWTLETPEQVAARIRDDQTLVPMDDLWAGVLNKILEFDSVELLTQFVERFGIEPIQRMHPTNGWRMPESEQMLTKLLEHGLNINARDWNGRTYLHHASFDDNTGRVDWLLRHGVDIDAIDQQSGTTALGLAAWAGNLQMVEFLLSRGADRALPANAEWAWPVTLATKQGHDQIVTRLQ